MFKSRLSLLLLAVVLLIPVLGVFAQDSAPVKWPDLGGREIAIAVENAYNPYNFLDPNNNNTPSGWDYDTFRAICELLNCKPNFVETSWDSMLPGIATGEFDVAADGITYTPERDQTVDFSQLYQAYDESLMIRTNETRFSTVAELKALGTYLVGTQVGTTNEATAIATFGQDHVKSFPKFPDAVLALQNDDVDAVEIDRPAGILEAQAAGNLKILPESLTGIIGLAFAYPPGSDLIDPVNAAMSALRASGKWDELYKKWFPAGASS